MKTRRKTSRTGWWLLLFAAVLAGTAWFVRGRYRPVLPAPAPEYVALLAEHETLREHSDEALAAWRSRSASMQEHAWSATAIAALRHELGSAWQWQAESPERVRLRATEPQITRWGDYVALIGTLGSRPGVAVETFAARAEGVGPHRQLAEIGLTLRFLVAAATMGDGGRTFPSPGALPVAAAEAPAIPRKVGAGTALRLSATSAEPPTAEPVSASFRSDPPWSRAGHYQPNNPEPKASP